MAADMTSGYQSNGIDFDDLFDLYVEGPYSQDTGRRIAGVDLSRRYAHISYGTKRADVGHRVGGLDLSNLWASKGSARYVLPFHGKAFAATNQALTGQQGQISVTVALSIYRDGSYSITESATGNNGFSRVGDAGTWLRPGDSADNYELMFSNSQVGAGIVGNGAPTFAPIGNGKTITLRVTINAASADHQEDSVSLSCHMRRTDGRTTVSTISARVSAAGWM